MTDVGIGIVGGGYMGKAHAVAFSSVGAVFDTALRPRLEMVCARSEHTAETYRKAFGFARATSDWRALVCDDRVDAVVIAAPQNMHREIALAAFAQGKHVLCEKPLGASLEDAHAMVQAAQAAKRTNMMGFNYIRTPASQFAYSLLRDGRIGDIVCYRAEMTEDFLADPTIPANWRTEDRATGTMGDLAPHIINNALRMVGPIEALSAQVQTVHTTRGDAKVNNDDQAQMMLQFENGAMGHIFASRVATGRKMGYAYKIDGTKGAICFDGEDQNALHLYLSEGPHAERGYRKILTGPEHPDYLPFCQGPGHGTGYQDQIIIEAKDFLEAIHTGQPKWPDFRAGLAVSRVVEAVFESSNSGAWVQVSKD